VIEEVRRDLNSWKLCRVVLVEDTGFNLEKNRRILQGAGGHYIIGEKIRLGRTAKPADALTCGGRYQTLESGLKFKEVIVGGDSWEKIKAEERLDRKFLISTFDDGLPARDVVLGYKQLAAVERVFRDLKHVVDVRPIRHRLPERIRAHVLLCWLAMLLIRVAENESGQTWFQIKKGLDKLQVGIHRTRAGEVWQANNPSDELKELFERLKLKIPPRTLSLPTPRGDRV